MASTLQWFDNFAAWRLIFVTLNRLFVWWIFQNRLMRNYFLQVETEKLLDTEKAQRTSRCVLEWLSGESISPLPNPCLKVIPSIIFQKLKTQQVPCLQLWQKRGHIVCVKTDELKYFFPRTNSFFISILHCPQKGNKRLSDKCQFIYFIFVCLFVCFFLLQEHCLLSLFTLSGN